ncbi:MAG TPA: response regulator [Steroidobacteraceae bacterium]|nr:response regulator [Steroidobacteraceae bacterium]
MSTIALYEDNDLMRGLLLEWLREAGYRAGTPVPEGVQVDLVIASVSMPRDTGLRQVEHICALHPGVPVIALSAQFRSGLSTMGPTAGSLGVRQVIAKPLTRDELLNAVRAIIGAP